MKDKRTKRIKAIKGESNVMVTTAVTLTANNRTRRLILTTYAERLKEPTHEIQSEL